MRTAVLCTGHILIPMEGILRLPSNLVAKAMFQSLERCSITLVVSLFTAQGEGGRQLELINHTYSFGNIAGDSCGSEFLSRLVEFN